MSLYRSKKDIRTDIEFKYPQVKMFEKKIAAKALIQLQRYEITVIREPIDIIPNQGKCALSAEKVSTLEEDFCATCTNEEECFRPKEIYAWPFSLSKIDTHIALLNQTYHRLADEIRVLDTSAIDDEAILNIVENYLDAFNFLTALINVLSSREGRNIGYDKFKEIVNTNDRWLPNHSKVGLSGDSLQQIYNFNITESANLWNSQKHYEDFIRWAIKQQDTAFCYECNNLFEICFSILDFYVLKGINIKQCKVCGKIFIPSPDYRQAYCSKECLTDYDKIRVEFARRSPCYKAYERIRDLLRKRREQSYSNQTVEEIANAERLAIDLWDNIKLQRAAGEITTEDALKMLDNFRSSLTKEKK